MTGGPISPLAEVLLTLALLLPWVRAQWVGDGRSLQINIGGFAIGLLLLLLMLVLKDKLVARSELQAGRVVQQALLPRKRRRSRAGTSGSTRPANEVGGDLVDFVTHEDGRTASNPRLPGTRARIFADPPGERGARASAGRRTRSSPAAARGLRIGRIVAQPGAFVLYLLLKLLVVVGTGLVVVIFGCLTCCLGFLPVVMRTAFQPLFHSERALSLMLLRQMGYDVAARRAP